MCTVATFRHASHTQERGSLSMQQLCTQYKSKVTVRSSTTNYRKLQRAKTTDIFPEDHVVSHADLYSNSRKTARQPRKIGKGGGRRAKAEHSEDGTRSSR